MSGPTVYAEARARVVVKLLHEYAPLQLALSRSVDKGMQIVCHNPAEPKKQLHLFFSADGSISRTLLDDDDTVQIEEVESREVTMRAVLAEAVAWMTPTVVELQEEAVDAT